MTGWFLWWFDTTHPERKILWSPLVFMSARRCAVHLDSAEFLHDTGRDGVIPSSDESLYILRNLIQRNVRIARRPDCHVAQSEPNLLASKTWKRFTVMYIDAFIVIIFADRFELDVPLVANFEVDVRRWVLRIHVSNDIHVVRLESVERVDVTTEGVWGDGVHEIQLKRSILAVFVADPFFDPSILVGRLCKVAELGRVETRQEFSD